MKKQGGRQGLNATFAGKTRNYLIDFQTGKHCIARTAQKGGKKGGSMIIELNCAEIELVSGGKDKDSGYKASAQDWATCAVAVGTTWETAGIGAMALRGSACINVISDIFTWNNNRMADKAELDSEINNTLSKTTAAN